MPLHEYECDACGHRFEAIRKFSDPPLNTCPKCGGAVRKLISSPAFQFKGTGWYITDYPKKKEQTGKADGSSDSAGADKTASEKSETSAKDKSETSAKKDKSETPAKSDAAPATTSSATPPSKKE
jgi:putative FmdB family regulatory protein